MSKNKRKTFGAEAINRASAIAAHIDETNASFKNEAGLVIEVELKSIVPNPYQPRRTYSQEQLEELAASLVTHGFLQPLMLRQDGKHRFTLIAGHRRWLAAQTAGLKTAPAIVRENVTEQDLRLLALIENIQREDLGTVDKARALMDIASSFNTTTEAAEAVGMKRTSLTTWLSLQDLGADVLDQCSQIPGVSLRTLLHILKVPAGRRPAEVRRLITAANQKDQPGKEENGKPVKEKARRPAVFSYRYSLPEKKVALTVEVRVHHRTGVISREDYRAALISALEQLDQDEKRQRVDISANS